MGILSFISGVVIGIAAGLLGVGGGEFRIPVLLYLLRDRPRSSAAVNLLVGAFTVMISLARRWNDQAWTSDAIAMAVVLAVGSLAGAILGARRASSLPLNLFRRAIEIYLFVVGAWMLFEGLTHTERILLSPTGTARLVIMFVVAVVVAFASAAVGVAGGELRIPALLYLCALPIKAAGTLSLVASLPTVIAGGATYRMKGELPREALSVALWMAAGSVIGVIIGAYFLPRVTGHSLKAILGAVVLAAAAGLVAQGRMAKLSSAS